MKKVMLIGIVILIIILIPTVFGEDITFIDKANNDGSLCNAASCSVAITVSEAENRMIIMVYTDEGTVVTVTGVTGGTVVGTVDVGTGGTQQHVEMWRIMENDITTGINNIQVDFSGSATGGGISLTAFSNVKQQAEEAENSGTSTTTETVSAVITTQTDGALIISGVGNGQGASTYTSHGTGQNEEHDFESTSAWQAVTYEIKTSAGADTQSHTYGISANRHAMYVAAFEVAPSAPAPSVKLPSKLTIYDNRFTIYGSGRLTIR